MRRNDDRAGPYRRIEPACQAEADEGRGSLLDQAIRRCRRACGSAAAGLDKMAEQRGNPRLRGQSDDKSK